MGWKEQYIEKIGCVDVEKLQIEAAQSIKILNLPRYLYKYRAFNNFSLDNLSNNTVWLNKPSEYNDPFEFVEYMDAKRMQLSATRIQKEEILEKFKESNIPDQIFEEARESEDPLVVIGRHHFKSQGLDDAKIDQIFEGTFGILKKHLIDANVQKIKKMQEQMKVCSFCEEHTNLLMWSHYADYHKGFCIEYDISKWQNNDVRKRILHPVIYQSDFFDVTDHLLSQVEKNTFNNLYPIISGATKSKEWEYEKEWRFIFQIGESFKTQNYLMNCQSKVFIGHRMTNENRKKILDICKTLNLPAYQAIPSNEKYELNFELIHN